MSGLYVLKSLSAAEEYIKVKGDISNIKLPIRKSETQYLNKEKIELGILESGGLEIPDVIYYESIFLISNRLKQLFDTVGIDYVFWKPADIHSEQFGIHETFWIIVPQRIDCLDIDNSIFDSEWDFQDGLVPMLNIEKIAVLSKNIGNFQIFKILGITDNNIYITRELFEKISLGDFKGIDFLKL